MKGEGSIPRHVFWGVHLTHQVGFTYFHAMLFLDRFSMRPMPSSTFVMSYILRFCTASFAAAWLRSKELPAAWCSCGITRIYRCQTRVPTNTCTLLTDGWHRDKLLSCGLLIVSTPMGRTGRRFPDVPLGHGHDSPATARRTSWSGGPGSCRSASSERILLTLPRSLVSSGLFEGSTLR